MDEPMAHVEHAPDVFTAYDTWPGGTTTTLRLDGAEDGPGRLVARGPSAGGRGR